MLTMLHMQIINPAEYSANALRSGSWVRGSAFKTPAIKNAKRNIVDKALMIVIKISMFRVFRISAHLVSELKLTSAIIYVFGDVSDLFAIIK